MNLPDLINMKTKHSRLNPGFLTTSVAGLTLLAQTVTAQQWTTNTLPFALISLVAGGRQLD